MVISTGNRSSARRSGNSTTTRMRPTGVFAYVHVNSRAGRTPLGRAAEAEACATGTLGSDASFAAGGAERLQPATLSSASIPSTQTSAAFFDKDVRGISIVNYL